MKVAIIILIIDVIIQISNGSTHLRARRFDDIHSTNELEMQADFEEAIRLHQIDRGKQAARRVAELFVTQSSSENPGWENAATALFAMMNKNIRIGYCGVAHHKKINLLQFIEEQKKRREQFSRTKVDQTPRLDFATSNISTGFYLDYNQTSKSFKQISNTRYYVVMVEVKESKFEIQKMVYSAPCLEHGEIYEPVIYYERVNPAGLEILHRSDLFGEFVNKQTYENGIHNWHMVIGNDNYFSGTICNKTDKYSKDEFINYMRLFFRRWMNTMNMTDSQRLIDGYKLMYETPEFLQFRLRMVMQIKHHNWIDNEDLREEWNIKFEAKYNEHGDGKWWINKGELACPLVRATNRPLREEYANQLVDDVFELMRREFNDSGVWYIAYDMIRGYTKQDDKDISSKLCHTDDPINYPHPMWIFKMGNTYNRVTVSREAVRTFLNQTTLQFTIRTSIMDDDKGYKNVDWNFTYYYDEKWDSWYMKHLEISCPVIIIYKSVELSTFIGTQASELGTTVWESKIDKKDFGGRVCSDINRQYTYVEFIRYMRLFFQRWKYVEEEQTRVFNPEDITVVVNEADQYIFKYAMMMKLDGTSDEQSWSLSVSAKYNTHGDKKWLINNMNLNCPSGINLRDKYGNVQVKKLIEGMKTEILLNGDWIYAYEFVRNLEKGARDRIVVTDCNDFEMHRHGLKWWHRDQVTNRNLTATFKEATAYKIDGDLLKFSVRSDIHENGKVDQQKDLAIEMSYDDKYDRWWITALKVGCTSKRSAKEDEEYYKYQIEDGRENGQVGDIIIH